MNESSDDMIENSASTPSTRVGNELPFESATGDMLRSENRNSRAPEASLNSARKKPVLLLVVGCLAAVAIVPLAISTLGSKQQSASQSQAKTEMIDVAKAQLTETSINKLIDESTKKVDPNHDTRLSSVEQALASLQEGQAKQLELLGELKSVSEALKNQVANHESAIEQLNKRIEPILTEKRPVVIQRDANSFGEVRKKPRKSIAPDPKPSVVPVPFPPVRLISIKNFNGKAGITISVNGEQSGLVLVGQIWRGFMVISADSSQRVATIARDGAIKNLTL